jgi:hypothetical protein
VASVEIKNRFTGETICTGVYGRKPNGATAGEKYKDPYGMRRHKPVITEAECRANAALIAAAPDLLTACRLALGSLEAAGFDNGTVRACRAAIAKAEGKEAPQC